MTRSRPLVVTAIYTLAAVVMTWPLLTNLTRAVGGDLGDPLLNCWILQWTGSRVLDLFHGNLDALHHYWNGNIFYPERLTLAYSEHLTPQMLQVLPVLAVSGNILLCYNLLFLSTFVLSGLAVYLLVKDLTGQPLAGFVAGLAFAFAPYRVPQLPHVQVLSSQWMPFALLGFRRFFVTGRTRPLAWGATALTIQNLSCGYYMLYFGPFAGAYCLYEMAYRRLLRSWSTWRALLLAAVAVGLVTWPFAQPYFDVRLLLDLGVRPLSEIIKFSADTQAYATSAFTLRLWGLTWLARPAAEGEGFQGLTTMLLGLIGAIAGCVAAARAGMRAGWTMPMRPWQNTAAGLLGVLLLAGVVAWFTLCVIGPFSVPVGNGYVVVRDGSWLLKCLVVVLALLVLLVPAARRFVRGTPDSAFGFFGCALIGAMLLSLGPLMRAAGLPIGAGPYQWFYAHVPGYDGLRVPTRYFMLVALFLSVLAGYGAAAIASRWRRAGPALVLAAGVMILAESWIAPMDLNVPAPSDNYDGPPHHVLVGSQISPLYKQIAAAPAGLVLIEFPFGDLAYDTQAVFYAGYHRKPLVNGYSGMFPKNYAARSAHLEQFPGNPDLCWQIVVSSGATHALVHEAAYRNGVGRTLLSWLLDHGAREVAVEGTDHLFQLK